MIEFKEHIISCKYCRQEMGENITDFIISDGIGKKGDAKNKYILFFVAFIVLLFLSIISVQYLTIQKYRGSGEMSPISEQTKQRLSNIKKETMFARSASVAIKNKNEEESLVQAKEVAEEEDFSEYSKEELTKRLSECAENREYKCIAAASVYLAKKSEGTERRKFRLKAIEALVEDGLCSNAMLNIMMLFKENPEPKEAQLAHFLNAKCYVKEKNYRDAEKIFTMIEKDAPELKREIKILREEIKKGEENGKQTKSEGAQDRDSP